ncbi:hypothetical protein [Pedobacter sp. BMA]|uniref:hypothetical protein n=1 Tax=Pedobacter sp. BMA TaxID=1663685 RepID=UPI00064A2B95|nr:hypothetical protein [Pedobacter sp. BMA]KLT64541.1 hypothetical protein AB669_12280 [Pedobacter sp. BMA]
MSQILLLSSPSQDDVNPILHLASELINRGEQVTFFSSDEFKRPIEDIGAEFKPYSKELDAFNKNAEEKPTSGLITALLEPMKFIDDIAVQIRGLKFDYAIFSPDYPYASIITRLLGIPRLQYSNSN